MSLRELVAGENGGSSVIGLNLAMLFEESLKEQVDIAVALALAEKDFEWRSKMDQAWKESIEIMEKAHRDSLVEELEKVARLDGVSAQAQSAILERILVISGEE